MREFFGVCDSDEMDCPHWFFNPIKRWAWRWDELPADCPTCGLELTWYSESDFEQMKLWLNSMSEDEFSSFAHSHSKGC
jgi:hypothetical protein